MNILLVGISHKTSSIQIREQFFLQIIERECLLSELRNDVRVLEAVVLSTCNRTEIYVRTLEEADPGIVLERLFRVKKLPYSRGLAAYFYCSRNEEAIRHFFEVATGLDSVVLGEHQILGQVKKSVEMSEQLGMLSKCFHVLTGLAIRAGKKCQHETDISCGGASVSWAAVVMANRVLEGLANKSALIIGAGKMGEMAIRQLRQAGVGTVYIMNRNLHRAQEIAGNYGGIPTGFWNLTAILPLVDVCICSAGAPHYLLEKEAVEAITRESEARKRLFIDISIPRNIDPDIAQIPNVELLTVDDLGNLVEESIRQRMNAVDGVRGIVEQKMAAFYQKMAKIQHFEARQNAGREQGYVAH